VLKPRCKGLKKFQTSFSIEMKAKALRQPVARFIRQDLLQEVLRFRRVEALSVLDEFLASVDVILVRSDWPNELKQDL
jgi:hypothetical protein